VRRLLLLVLGSAILFSACSSSKASTTPAASATSQTASASPADSSAAATPTNAAVTVTPASSFVMQDGNWVVLAHDTADFTAKFPTQPTLTTSTTTTAIGDAPTSLWTDEEGGNLIYYVMTAKYPTGSLGAAKASALYDGAVNGMVGGTAGLALSGQGDVTLNGHIGRSFLLTSSLGSLQGVVVVVGDSMYMAYAAYTSSVDPAMIQTFLADFQLTI